MKRSGDIAAAALELPDWVPANKAAEALGISARALRKRALSQEWLTKMEPCQGGQQMLVHKSCLDESGPKPNAAGIARYDAAPEWAKAKAHARHELIIYIEGRCAEDLTACRKRIIKSYNRGGHKELDSVRELIPRASYATYMRWRAAYLEQGIAGLLPGHKGRAKETAPDVEDRLNQYAKENDKAAQVVYDYLVEDFGKERVPSYTTVLRRVKAIREANAEALLLMHKGPRAHRHAALPSIGNQKALAKFPNHIWEVDGSPADVFCADGKRHKVVGIADRYTGRYHFRLHPDCQAIRVGQTIRSAILAWGLPSVVIMDNGTDYQSKRVQAMLTELGIRVVTCDPYSPDQKGTVERSFRTLSNRVFKELTGYSGNCQLTRKENIQCVYSAENIQEKMDKWVEYYWEERPQKTRGNRRPRELAGDRLPKRVEDERILDVLLGDVGERQVNQGVIRYKNGVYFHEALLTLDAITAKVNIREDCADAGRIYVFVGSKYLCTAEDRNALGYSPADYRKLKNKKLQLARARVREIEAELEGGSDESFERFLEQKAAKKPGVLPGPTKVVAFPELSKAADDGQAPETEAAPARAGDIPAWWASDAEHYEWCLKRAAAGMEVPESHLEWMAEYEQSAEYASQREFWEFLAAGLQTATAQGGN